MNEAEKTAEFSFDIKKAIKYLWRNKIYIIFFMILFAAVGGYTLYKIKPPQYTTYERVELTFAGIENGQNPDGSSFSATQIIAPKILNEAAKDLNKRLGTDNFQNISYYISIEEDIPFKIKELQKLAAKNRKDFTYHPSAFLIKFTTTSPDKFSDKAKKVFLNEIVQIYKRNFINKYGKGAIVPYSQTDDMISQADFIEQIGFYDLLAADLIKNLTELKKDGDFTSPKTGKSISYIVDNVTFLKKSYISSVQAEIQALKLTKDLSTLLNKLKGQLKNLQNETLKKQAEANAVDRIFRQYNETLLKKDSNSKSSNPVELNLFKGSDSNDALLKILVKTQSAAEQSKTEVQILEAEIKDLENSKTINNNKTIVKKIKEIHDKLIYWAKESNLLYKDYINNRFSSVIAGSTPIVINSSLKNLVILLIISIIPLIIACGFALFDQMVEKL